MIVVSAPKPAQRNRLPSSYLVWLGGALTSQLGSAAMFFALTWAATAHGGTAAGLVLSSIVAPSVLFVLVGGAVGDRAGARRVMLTCDAVMVIVAVAVAVTAGAIGTPVALLLIAGVLTGVNDAFYYPSSGSMPRRMVEPKHLGRAVALRQSGVHLVRTVGAPVGGALVAFGGLSFVAWVDAGTFLVAFTVLLLIRPRFTPPAPEVRRHIARETLDGVLVVFRTPGLGTVLLLIAAVAGVFLPVGSLLVPLLAREHTWGAHAAGILVGALGLGTVLVTLVVARVGTYRLPGLAASGACAVTGFGVAAIGVAPSLPVAVAGAFVAGAGVGTFVSHLAPVLLSAAPESHLARVQAVFSLIQSVSLLVMSAGLGAIAHALGPVATVGLCATVLTLCAVTGFASRQVRHLR
ncbi:MFS transporter [Haloechinothrix halophila]|uniref:MFS transporter n=1 Tax=Haloechinothrix halophila TaxID=1069073 RepID=UPI00040E9A00|nr:MFS transporter [Haloechinothrix halophila]